MLEHGPLRDLFKKSSKVFSQNIVIAEWNWNRYQQITKYGIYKGTTSIGETYSASDPDILDGYNYLIYDDGSTKISPNAENFSSLASAFKPDRPNSGIVLLSQKLDSIISTRPRVDMRATNLTPASARFYPFMENREYDYYDSAKVLDRTDPDKSTGISNANGGGIKSANPFVVYSSSFPSNKITIKVQDYESYPTDFRIEYLPDGSNTWTTAFTSQLSDGKQFSNGELSVYFNGAAWTTTEANITDLSEITTPSTQAVKIRGVRLSVTKMAIIGKTLYNGRYKRYKSSLELIEISPRLQVDLSSYTESFSVNSSIGESEFGLPTGTIVASNGNLALSNDTGAFLSSSTIASYNMLNPNVEFRLYQKVTASVSGDNSSIQAYTIPIKQMFSDKWDTNGDWVTNVAFSDKIRVFQEKNVTDLAFITDKGVPFSVLILMLLDNLGITGYEFKKTSDSAQGEDTKIRNFFCSKEQTLASVLEEIAVATQCSMYIDAVGNLSVLTKEKIWQGTVNDQSFSNAGNTTASTNFWIVADEDFSSTGVPSYVSSSYIANAISLIEDKINPITSGEVAYHSYGLRKERGAALLEKEVPREYLEDIPFNSIIDAGYTYKGNILWSAGSDNNSVLASANLLKDIKASRLKDIFTSDYIAQSEQDAIRAMYAEANNNENKIQSLVMFLDRNDMYTFSGFSGYVFIDMEYIEYYGKVFHVQSGGSTQSSIRKIVFSEEELNDLINDADLRSAIVPIGLVIKPKFKVQKSADRYKFNVVNDGRGALDSSDNIKVHAAYNENTAASDILPSNKFKLSIGMAENKAYDRGANSGLKVETTYNYKEVKQFNKIKKKLMLPRANFNTYLGTLKLSGPKAPQKDLLSLSASSDAGVAKLQNVTNKEIDKLIPGTSSSAGSSFDEFVYFWGERDIYAQKIVLPFSPRLINVRMRLFSGQKKSKDGKYIASTMSSIAGVGFGIRNNGTGYYLEVESIGAGKNAVSPVAAANNLRFYKLYIDKKNPKSQGKLTAQVLATGAVNAQTVLNSDVRIITEKTTPADAVFDLQIVISRNGAYYEYDIYYGNNKINDDPIKEKITDATNIDTSNICLFVRNDSQAIYEYVAAATSPTGKNPNTYFDVKNRIDLANDDIQDAQRGLLAVNTKEMVKNTGGNMKVYFNDFARLVREVKKYTARFDSPAVSTRLIDISNVNPQYLVKYSKIGTFGAEIQVLNTSTGTISLSEDSDLPLYIFGISLEELSGGNISVDDINETDIESNKRVMELQRNKAIYGNKGFSLDSRFIQSPQQARMLLKWITTAASRQRMILEMEIFAIPILELGDKVKVVSKDRGYYENNTYFGNKTFVVSSIDYSSSSDGPSMSIKLIEVGDK